MSREEHDMLEAAAKAQARDKADLVRWLIRIAGNVAHVGECSSIVHQSCTNEASVVRRFSEEKSVGTQVAIQSTPEKKEEKSKKKDPELAPLDVTGRILADLNKRAGTGFQARGKVARRLIAARMNDGYKEADFIEVNRKKCNEWKDNPKMKGSLTYETLYGNKFEKYLGQLEATGQQSMFKPQKQSAHQDYKPEPGRTDGNDF
jgi:uncharacterized phage protein (TIGR02220 family)